MEIISIVEGNSQLEFNVANLRATDPELQTSESTTVTHESIVEVEKIYYLGFQKFILYHMLTWRLK